MPATAPYDIVYAAMLMAKTRLNDAISTLTPVGGQLLDNAQAFTQQIMNTAWRRMLSFLSERNYSRLFPELLISSLPVAATNDPALEVSLTWTGYFDGLNQFSTPVLPQDLITPAKLWERASGQTPPGGLYEMDRVFNGLPPIPKQFRNFVWEWRDDGIYMPGASGATDLKIRYAAYLPDFLDNSPTANTPWFQQPIPIMRCLDPLSCYACHEIAKGRKDLDAAVFLQDAEAAAMLVVNRDSAQPRAILKPSEYGKMRDQYTPGGPPPPKV